MAYFVYLLLLDELSIWVIFTFGHSSGDLFWTRAISWWPILYIGNIFLQYLFLWAILYIYFSLVSLIEHQRIALTFKPIVTWLAPWKASQLKLTSFIKECMSSMCTACGLAHFTRMDLSNSFAWVVSIHLFILNRITELLFGYSIELTNILFPKKYFMITCKSFWWPILYTHIPRRPIFLWLLWPISFIFSWCAYLHIFYGYPPVTYSAHLPLYSDLFCTQSSLCLIYLIFFFTQVSFMAYFVYMNDIIWICVHVPLVTYLLQVPHLGDIFSTFWRLILYTYHPTLIYSL